MFKKRNIALSALALIIMSVFVGAVTYAGEAPALNPGDTRYIVTEIQLIPVDVNAWFTLTNVECYENGVNDPEQDWYYDNNVIEKNDIDSVITFGLWIDRDGDTGGCDTVAGDEWIIEENLHISDIKEEAIPLGKIQAGSIVVVSSYHMDESTENWAQSDTITFDIELYVAEPQPPVAVASVPDSTVEDKAVTFDGSSSYDPDGHIVSYSWDFGDEDSEEGEILSHTYSDEGTYTVTLTVTDNDGLTDRDVVTIKVTRRKAVIVGRPNTDPIANAGPNQKYWVGHIVYFDGSKSKDPDGYLISYEWDFGDETKSGVEVQHIYYETGVYDVTLTVKDNRMAEDSDTCKIKISEPKPFSDKFAERVQGGKKNHVVEAFEEANTTVTLDTTDNVTVTVLRYEENPYPGDPIPAMALPNYVDVEVSDPDAVVWPIYVEMFYTDEEVEGLDEGSLGIYYWMNGTWQRCSDTGVDTENNIVWAYMTAEEASGSPIVVAGMHAITPPPLPPYLDNLNVTPAVIELGDNVTISFDIMNFDSQHINYGVDIYIEDVNVTRIWVDLGGYEFKTVSHTITPVEVGTFKVTVHRMTAGFTVKAAPLPAKFGVSDLFVSPDEVEEGETVTVSVDVTNVGETEGSYTVELVLDGVVVESEEITSLGGGMTVTVVFELTRGVGSYTVDVDGLTGSFTVKAPPKPAEFMFSDLRIFYPGVISPEVERDETVTVTVSVEAENVGELMGSQTVELKVDGYVEDSQETTLEGGASITILFELTRGEGTYQVEVEGMTDTFTVVTTEPPFWMRPGTVAGIIIVIIVAATILYFGWKGKIPSLYPEIDEKI